MENERHYTVYKHTSPDGKVYIGATSNDPNRRWQNGYGYRENKDFYSDIEYYGWDNFSHYIVASDLTEPEAYKLEEKLIQQFCATDPVKGYNKSVGGKGNRGVVRSAKTRMKIGDAERGTKHHFYGKHLSESHRRKISESNKGKVLSEEHKNILRAKAINNKNMLGKHHSDETKRKIAAVHRGIKLTEEHKQKISESIKKKVLCIETNTVYDSLDEAAIDTGTSVCGISSACNGRYKTSGGYHWEYYNDQKGGNLDVVK